LAQRILVVEDEPAVAETIAYALETDGFEPVWAPTAGCAHEALAAGGVDLVILDIGLLDEDGFEFCREVRKTSDVPVIFLTARAGEVDRVVGLEIGGDDYVVKPFSPRELTARVKAVLRRAPGRAEKPAGASPGAESDFVVDAERIRITYCGTPLDLSRYEHRMLKVLLEHPGWVYSREKLMALAWEEPDTSGERTVDAHIKSLRAKLRAVKPDADPIRTHRGLGYSLREAP